MGKSLLFDVLSEQFVSMCEKKQYCKCGNDVKRFISLSPNGFYCSNCKHKLYKKDELALIKKMRFVDFSQEQTKKII
jgi:hypothetical protein